MDHLRYRIRFVMSEPLGDLRTIDAAEISGPDHEKANEKVIYRKPKKKCFSEC